ncbi:hypothetical protein FAZ78_00380 [Cereibacter changlensis]|uniref:Uncharacterized protein n=1 Tax=Cereibacter changlensis TaxID=402884 RepID=A0A4U0Z539_9RHOB|nr:hypothetical protein [Cereibacter changlensis]TKA98549.1 hypothetical protein FAZ78_00380 [Cereibacter changlensis]
MRDLFHNISTRVALAPAVQAAAASGEVIDLKGSSRVAFSVVTGAIAGDGDFGVKMQESDTTTSGDFTDVAADQVSTNAPATLAAASAYRLGYSGFKRYVRLALTKAGGTSIALGAVALLDPLDKPVA